MRNHAGLIELWLWRYVTTRAWKVKCFLGVRH